ncbi:DnaD domain protein [Lachnospiraceae bacterium MD329]|nr:DnaD domain protein [Lachnospiraceae bacterium MD329]
MPKFNCRTEFIPVSADFVERLMPSANGAYVKVYLMALALGVKSEEMSTAEMAGKLNLLESDVVNALEYWNKLGALKYSREQVSFGSDVSEVQESKPQKKDMEEIRGAMTENPELADLCTLSQEILGKTLRNKDIETLYWFYDELGLSPEVITMLLEYCVSKDKRNMNYIEKVAISWHENGIVTIDAADRFINNEKEKSGYFYSLRKLFGIDNRSLSKTEETYLKSWRDDLGMDENMVGLAYEYCIMQTSKLSFPYMNSIIKRWNELGIHTVPEAERDHEDFKTKSKQNNLDVYNDDDFNYAELEKIMQDKG